MLDGIYNIGFNPYPSMLDGIKFYNNGLNQNIKHPTFMLFAKHTGCKQTVKIRRVDLSYEDTAAGRHEN